MIHVLIVEDHEENRNLLKMLLEANGYRVTAAGDGVEALDAARRDPPDAIVSDALMPKMDGFALCRAWMQDAALKSIPFIFYSATYVHPEDEKFAAALAEIERGRGSAYDTDVADACLRLFRDSGYQLPA